MFKLEELPYSFNALEPVIDEKTMQTHYSKHHQAYVNKLNNLIEGTGFEDRCIKCVLKHLDEMPKEKLNGIKNNAGGVYNHNLFWQTMLPGGSKEPYGKLKDEIIKTFGSVEEFKDLFNQTGLKQFGSGWVWLVLDKDDKLKVISTSNQDSPISNGQIIILGNDVWEHAYYLKHTSNRLQYLKDWWQVVNWDVVVKRYEESIK